jgi:hypothetical protein
MNLFYSFIIFKILLYIFKDEVFLTKFFTHHRYPKPEIHFY